VFVKYFQFAEQPFGATPDPRFLFQSTSHREALASLYCGFYANRGFTALIAEPGMGKTTLLFEFLEHIREYAKTVFLFNTFCGPDDIVTYILTDSGIRPGTTVAERYGQINELLTAEARKGHPVVLVIDEAQNLSTHALEGIRLLTNFETTRTKLLQIVLAGQPQLARKLVSPELAQLRQRISTFCELTPLRGPEVRNYIQHRLEFAGYKGKPLFTPTTFNLIAEASSGVPRMINTLCFNSLCLCRARSGVEVNEEMVRAAILDLELPDRQSEPTLPTPNNVLAAPHSETTKPPHPLRLFRVLQAAAPLLALCVITPGKPSPKFERPSPARTASSPSRQEALAPSQLNQREPSAPSSDPARSRATDPISVTVAKGDTLTGIAAQYLKTSDAASIQRIQELNPKLTDPDRIESGMTLRLPNRESQNTSNLDKRIEP